MTWSNGSTSRLALALSGVAFLSLALAGCGTRERPVPPPPLRGYVRLETLMRRHPGWSGVSRYDGALRRLQASASSLPPADRPDEKIAILPALSPEPGLGAGALPDRDIGGIAGRLTQVQNSLLAGLRMRRELARLDQLRSQRDIWRREALQQFPPPTETALIQPDLELQLLSANVRTLERTLNNWKAATPPAPKREALRASVQASLARLNALLAERAQARDTARSQFLEQIKDARTQRTAYVQAQSDALEAQLLAVDTRVITGQQGRLARQRAALVEALARPASVSVPLAGDGGPQSLPKGRGTGQAALSRMSLLNAEMHLKMQRARWIYYLSEDTQAAAQDIAQQKNWNVTTGLPRPGDRDLTQNVALALASGVWRTAQ